MTTCETTAAGPELAAVRDGDVWRFDTVTVVPDTPESLVAEPADDTDATVASAIPVRPPAAWFDDPGLPEPTALTVTADGRVYGHAAAWGVRHIGLPGCRTAPKSASGYRYYRTGQVETDDGSMVATGRITLGTGHADLAGNLTAASEHYDNTGAAVADVSVGEDAHGIWFAGALRPDVTPAQVRTLRASSLSGDWRPAGNHLEMVGLLAVNIPGFPTPRAALAASGAEVAALVAAGVVLRADASTDTASEEEPVPDTATAEQLADETREPEAPAETPDVDVPAPGEHDDEPVTAAGDSEDSSEAFEEGDEVSLGDTGLTGRVTSTEADGGVALEVVAPVKMLSRVESQTASADPTVAALTSITAALTSITERLDRQDAERRAERGAAILDGLPG